MERQMVLQNCNPSDDDDDGNGNLMCSGQDMPANTGKGMEPVWHDQGSKDADNLSEDVDTRALE